ncbi:hypothetical protein B0T19DRAFT_297276 [Cercophora scortea]|uniref:Uncharacterized protein n=1 Tax=Cercophora scortea TaxID=314031 RepID=A0AAE0M3W5_9PEZI|nr:hypothetical protein B0T19DRAFT_297276 [Cercophora scortea]
MASRSGLSDDWEDIGDDNLSVISLPTSDTEHKSAVESTTCSRSASPAPVASKSARRNSTSSPNNIPAGPVSRGPPPRYIDTVSDSTTSRGQEEAGQSVRDKSKAPAAKEDPSSSSSSSGFVQSQRLEDPFRDFQDPPYHDSDPGESSRSGEEEVDELFDDGSRDANPLFIYRTLASLRDILAETVLAVRDTSPPIRDFLDSSHLVCDLLSRQVNELVPIVSGYADIYYASSRDFPLDPGLHGWLSGVRVKVLSLQAEAQLLAREPDLYGRRSHVLQKISKDLFDYKEKMGEFLPIMQVDFSEFQTRQMNMPTSRPLGSAPIDIPRLPSPVPRPRSVGSSKNVWLLRYELYALKDLVGQTVPKITNMNLSSSMLAHGSDTSLVYAKVFTTLGILLSNYGSDWIESGLNGGFTHAEFVEIDPYFVRDLAGRLMASLRGTSFELDGWGQPLQPRHLIDDNQQLEELAVLGQILDGMLTPTRV